MRRKAEKTDLQVGATSRGSLFNKAKQEFYNIRAKILKQLAACKKTGSLIGVHALALGEGTVVSSVKDIYTQGSEEFVILKWYDDSSHIHSETHVSLDEIIEVCPVSRNSRYVSIR